MSKKQQSAPRVTQQEAPSEALATTSAAPLSFRPSFLPSGPARGSDGIEGSDVKPPRLVVCQSMTPQRKREDPSYIKGLDEGHLFNTLDGKNYGEGPINFTVIKFLGKRGIEFYDPKTDGLSGVKDFNVALTDERMEFTTDANSGKRLKPKATLFYDYLILLTETNEILALSLKGTQIKVAQKLNSLMKLSNVDTFAVLYTLRSVSDKKDIYTFYNVRIDRAKDSDGEPAWVSEATYRYAEAAFKSFEGKTITVDRTVDAVEAAGSRQPGDEDVEF